MAGSRGGKNTQTVYAFMASQAHQFAETDPIEQPQIKRAFVQTVHKFNFFFRIRSIIREAPWTIVLQTHKRSKL